MSRAEQDKDAWNTWTNTKDKKDLSTLFGRVRPIISKEVSRWATGPVARPILNLEAKKLALNAFKSFDPQQAQLATHVTNQLKGLSRIVYTYTNPARLPEHKTLKVGTYLNAKMELEEQLGREPTMMEISEQLAWNPNEVERYSNELRAGYSTSKPTPPGFDKYDADKGVVDFLYNDLHDQDKLVMEHTTGYGGKPVLGARDLEEQTGMTQGQISHAKRRIRRKIEEIRGFR